MFSGSRKEYINRRINSIFQTELKRATALGILFWIASAVPEYLVAPDNFNRFIAWRIGVIVALAVIWVLARHFKKIIIQYILAYAGILASSITIEYLILHSGGHQSIYYVAVILLSTFVFGLMPARFLFHLSVGIIIYSIYLFPILLTEEITDIVTFTNANFYVVIMMIVGLSFNYLNQQRLSRELSVQYNSERDRKRLKQRDEQIRKLSDVAFDGISITENGVFREVNASFAAMFGYQQSEIIGAHVTTVVAPEWRDTVMRNIENDYQKPYESRCVKKNGESFPVEVCGKTLRQGERTLRITSIRDISERTQAEEDREKLIKELQQALAEIKTLRGIIPICSACKKIRDDEGYWHQVEVYIHQHSQARFSHGICPDCARRLYPDFYPDDE